MRRAITSLATAALLIGSVTVAPAIARDRSDRVELTASQLTDQAAARAAQLKADLRLTPEQDKNWSGVQAELVNVWRKRGEQRQSWRNARAANREGSTDLIEQMRKDGDNQIERGNDLKKLAAAAEPLYVSLDDQQKRRFTEALFQRSRDRRSD
jgi:DNA polymerase III delta prime subunit